MVLCEISYKPILRWPGGKRWLVPEIKKIWHKEHKKYLCEPFAGGMAISLGVNPKYAIINDINVHLINFYQQVKKGLQLPNNLVNSADFYYAIRDKFNSLLNTKKINTSQAATMFYYLIRTGFNGLCRFNSSGVFNVPFGHITGISYKKDLLPYKNLFTHWQFSSVDFAKLIIPKDCLIYADPPYDGGFVNYSHEGFTWEDQERLAEWLVTTKNPVILSNSATPRMISLYKSYGFAIKKIMVKRSIAAKVSSRKDVTEMLAYKL